MLSGLFNLPGGPYQPRPLLPRFLLSTALTYVQKPPPLSFLVSDLPARRRAGLRLQGMVTDAVECPECRGRRAAVLQELVISSPCPRPEPRVQVCVYAPTNSVKRASGPSPQPFFVYLDSHSCWGS